MVCGYECPHVFGQVELLGQFQPFAYVRYDYLRAAFGRQLVVGVDAFLVLGEERRVDELAYVVVERAGAHEQFLGSYLLGHVGCKVCNLH